MVYVPGSSGNDTLNGTGGDDTLEGFGGADVHNGGGGFDTASYANSAGGVNVYMMTGFATATGDAAGDTFNSIENVRGTNFADGIYGDNGDNTLWGGGGTDTLYGGLGINYLYGEDGHDNIVGGAGIDHMDGGNSPAGAENGDTASYQLSTAGVTVSLVNPSINTGDAAGDTYVNIEDVTGTNHVDTIYGDDGAVNNLWGLAGDDRIYGNGGLDVMIGDAGADYLDGGAGRDIADYETSNVGLTASLLNPSINTGHAAGDTYVSIEDLAGSLYDDILYGDNNDNTILAWPGNDTVYGMGGNDSIDGMGGADTIDGGDGLDTVSYNQAGLSTTAPWGPYTTVGVGVRVSLVDPSVGTNDATGDRFVNVENVIGSAFADFIAGNDVNNVILGGLGADELRGAGGDDLLEGNEGADVLNGEGGYDYASYSRATSGVIAFLGSNIYNTGDAAGDILISIEGFLGSEFGDILGGDNFSNTIQSAGGNDWLFGGNGDDLLVGGEGNDILAGGFGNDLIDGGNGIDVAYFRDATAGVTVNFVDRTQNRGEAQNDSYANVENLWGSDFNDSLTGDGGSNQVYGFDGTDQLFGGGGDDNMYGGSGPDTLSGGTGSDTYFFLYANEGGDTITDFQHGVDRVFFSQYWFGIVTPGPAAPIDPSLFVWGTNPTAQAARPQFLWNTSNNQLWFDADGTGTQAAVHMATFSAGTVITAEDLWRA